MNQYKFVKKVDNLIERFGLWFIHFTAAIALTVILMVVTLGNLIDEFK